MSMKNWGVPLNYCIQNGFVGSVSDWLTSLKGVPGAKGDTGQESTPIFVEGVGTITTKWE